MSPILFSALVAAGLAMGAERPPVCEHTPGYSCSFFDLELPADTPAMVARVYSVTDLVTPIAMVVGEGAGKTPSGELLDQKLIELIVSTIAPKTWTDQGGEGAIQYYPIGGALVVSQTPDVQEQVAELLEALRRLQDLEVLVEIRVLSVSRDFLENADLGIDGKKSGPGFLEDKQVRELLEAVQSDRRSSIMTQPRLTVLNGQLAHLCVGEELSYVTGIQVENKDGEAVAIPKVERFIAGTELKIQPVISADRKTVTIGITGKLTDHDPSNVAAVPVITALTTRDAGGERRIVPVTQFVQLPKFQTMDIRKSFQVADGKTAVLVWGTHMVNCRQDVDVDLPVLGSVPFVNRLFSAMTCERDAQEVILLVTPRIICDDEVEQPAAQPKP
jgi:type II secretory pathway component GspD/PulD (secretin)